MVTSDGKTERDNVARKNSQTAEEIGLLHESKRARLLETALRDVKALAYSRGADDDAYHDIAAEALRKSL